MLLVVLVAALLVVPQSGAFFVTPRSQADMAGKQAVVETTMGTFVIALRPDAAPNHVGHFMDLAEQGAFEGRTFHRVIRYGIIQGGDPLTVDPAKAAEYGTGGLRKLRREPNDLRHTAGAVSAVLVPNEPDSAGDQFFVCATDQPALDGQYTVFGEVVEGLEVVQAISAVEADANGAPAERIEMRSVTIRDTPPPPVVPFSTETADELAAYRAVLDTAAGTITLEFLTSVAPEHARAFLQLADAGVYDGTPFHRVAKGFVIQGGALAFREAPLTQAQQALVRELQPEFSDTATLPGVVSMARGDDPASATTSFFICTGECRTLDGVYTAFARVVSGMDVVEAIEAGEVDGETPRAPVMVRTVRIERRDRSPAESPGDAAEPFGRRADEVLLETAQPEFGAQREPVRHVDQRPASSRQHEVGVAAERRVAIADAHAAADERPHAAGAPEVLHVHLRHDERGVSRLLVDS
jgi:peptidyl-prolyl cis-trans isomerase B (cyclophilin B)